MSYEVVVYGFLLLAFTGKVVLARTALDRWNGILGFTILLHSIVLLKFSVERLLLIFPLLSSIVVVLFVIFYRDRNQDDGTI